MVDANILCVHTTHKKRANIRKPSKKRKNILKKTKTKKIEIESTMILDIMLADA